MKVLVVGSGGREHTLAWKIAQSPKADKIFCAPGNAGMSQLAECVDIKAEDINGLLDFAKKNVIDLTVVGPEAPLVAGIADIFHARGMRVFGPGKNASLLEGSKVFCKEKLIKFGVPTGRAEIFSEKGKALSYIESEGFPVVVKADGLAAGKGVYICRGRQEAEAALEDIMDKKIFGSSGDRVLVEECLHGEEVSFLALTDGKNIAPLATSQDHKKIYDGDKGPNTGGMGAYSPAPVITGELSERVMKEIMEPVIWGMAKEGKTYKGVLYAGLMITSSGPKVLEFNCRFGDPETQAILPRLKDDLLDVMDEIVNGDLSRKSLSWDERPCVCIVLASGGYPGKYEKGKAISGLNEAASIKDVVVFHAGTKTDNSTVLTSGGRVLGVTALGDDIEKAINKAYEAAGKINFDGIYYRKDIGHRAIRM